MAITNGNYVTSPVPHTTLREKLRDGVLVIYEIKADNGYLLHDKDLDQPVYDEMFIEILGVTPWFTGGGTSVRLDYDYTVTTQGEYKYTDENGMEVTVPVTMIGPREFYTVSEGIVPENQKLGGGTINPPVTE